MTIFNQLECIITALIFAMLNLFMMSALGKAVKNGD